MAQRDWKCNSGLSGPHSVRRVHILILVLVDIVVEIMERLVTLVPVQVDGVWLRDVGGFERAGHLGHELTEDADAAVPEGRLR